MRDVDPQQETAVDPAWQRYGDALARSMAGVSEDLGDDMRALLMETADYWLAVGIAMGISDPDTAARLLPVIEADAAEREELAADAAQFLREASEERAQ
ncbi:MAG: hypothetical protein ABR498_04155 [Candidatus Dormibacteria bacterium]